MSKIWHSEDITLETLNARGKGCMVEWLGIEFIEAGADFLRARMPVDHRTRQPLGILHGGSSCVLAETIGSTAANYVINFAKQYCVGLTINTNHIRSIREGWIIGTAHPLHLGGSTQVWNIAIHNEEEN